MEGREAAVAAKEAGNLMFKLGDYESAIGHFTRGLAADPDYHVLYSNRSAAHAKAGDYPSALADAEKVIQLKPEWPKGYARKGAALMFLGRPAHAYEAYNAGVQIDPQNSACIEGVGSARRAAAAAEAALHAQGDAPVAITTVGGATVVQGKQSDAAKKAAVTAAAAAAAAAAVTTATETAAATAMATATATATATAGVRAKRRREDGQEHGAESKRAKGLGGSSAGDGADAGTGRVDERGAQHLLAGAEALTAAGESASGGMARLVQGIEEAAKAGHAVYERVVWLETKAKLGHLVEVVADFCAKSKHGRVSGYALILVESEKGAPILAKHLAKAAGARAAAVTATMDSAERASVLANPDHQVVIMTHDVALLPGSISPTWVIVYDMPDSIATYVMSSNQTARFGARVAATITFVYNDSGPLFNTLAAHWHARRVKIPLALLHSPYTTTTAVPKTRVGSEGKRVNIAGTVS